MKNYRILILSILLAACSTAAVAQKGKPAPLPAATPAAAPEPQVFITYEEKFSIELPAKPNVARDIKAGEMFGVKSGKQYTWAMKEGTISVALANFDEPMHGDGDFLSFAAGMKESIEMGNAGKIVTEKVDKTGPYRLVDYVFTVPNGNLMLSRWHVSNDQYYNIMVVLKQNNAEDKEMAIKVMDSFKMLVAAPLTLTK